MTNCWNECTIARRRHFELQSRHVKHICQIEYQFKLPTSSNGTFRQSWIQYSGPAKKLSKIFLKWERIFMHGYSESLYVNFEGLDSLLLRKLFIYIYFDRLWFILYWMSFLWWIHKNIGFVLIGKLSILRTMVLCKTKIFLPLLKPL